MRELNLCEVGAVAGGESWAGDNNGMDGSTCTSAAMNGFGIGAAAGTAIGTGFGLFGGPVWGAVGAALGGLVGGLFGGAAAISNNPSCGTGDSYGGSGFGTCTADPSTW